MAFLQQSFEEAGVKVETHLMTGDLSTLIYTDANYDMLYLAGGGSRPCDMYKQLTELATYSFIGDNEYKQGLFNDLFYAYQATEDAAEAKELANQMQALGYETCYIIPVYGLNSVTMYNAAHVEVPVDYMQQSVAGWKQPRYDLWTLK
jgi:ABC-type transport system substrate-binding protein